MGCCSRPRVVPVAPSDLAGLFVGAQGPWSAAWMQGTVRDDLDPASEAFVMACVCRELRWRNHAALARRYERAALMAARKAGRRATTRIRWMLL